MGGGAYLAGKRHEQREAEQSAPMPEEQAAPQAPPMAGPSSDAIDRLKELAQLHEQGVLTDQEFDQQKARLLAT
ncbi:MAG TPA: SHOCT domain-containing protein [Thermoleophilaceae bacterium]|nr:SHOCT domain-containing protein [Thermoleophilaceae bacterium]